MNRMSKELEALYRLATRNSGNHRSIEEVDKDFKIIEKALKDYESIDNAEPSKALECLEDIYRNGVFISEVSFTKQHPTIRSPETNKTIGEQCDTIKQALLKAQEPKHYLKWEDLEFKEKRQEIPVRMGETTYTLVLRKTDGGNKIAKLLSPKRNYMGEWGDIFHEKDIQFFNDLHLERVEE